MFDDELAQDSVKETAHLEPSGVSAIHLAADSAAQKDDEHEPQPVEA
jgi:hypothetical protein